MASYSPLTTGLEGLNAAAVEVLTDAGYPYSPLTQSWPDYLATAASGLTGSTHSAKTTSVPALMALIANDLDGSSLSVLQTPYYGLLAAVADTEEGGEPIPDPVVVFQPSSAMSGSDNNPNTGFRVAATVTQTIDKGFRLTLRSGTGTLELANVGFGKQSAGAVATAALSPITFNDGQSAVTLPANTSITSDYIYLTDVTFAPADVMLVGFAIAAGSTALSSGNSNVTSYFGAFGNSQLADPSYAASAGNCFALMSIEARDYLPPAVTGIPLTFNAPQFVGMTDSLGENPSPGSTLSNYSINSMASGDASIFLASSATVNNCRVNSRECIRIGGNGGVITNCYLEATGVPPDDHADVIQCFSVTPPPGSLVEVTNTAIVAHEIAATAGFFWSDGYTGTLRMTNVMLYGGPYGLRASADAGTVVRVELENVYCVYPFGGGPIFLEQIGDGDMIIDKWTNVRRAYIIGGQLIPGASIPQPVI